MTRDEYEALSLEEADITFHADQGLNVTYVTVVWYDSERSDPAAGFKFVVSNELMPAPRVDALTPEEVEGDNERRLRKLASDRQSTITRLEKRWDEAKAANTVSYDLVKSWVRDAVGEMPMAESKYDVDRACDVIGKHIVRGMRDAGMVVK